MSKAKLAPETEALLAQIDARKTAGISDRALSISAGLSESFIKNLRHGKQRHTGAENLARIARVLNCTVDDLMTEDVVAPPAPAERPRSNGTGVREVDASGRVVKGAFGQDRALDRARDQKEADDAAAAEDGDPIFDAPAVRHIDARFLNDVIMATEDYLEKNNLRVPVAKKGILILALYTLAMENAVPGEPLNMARYSNIIRLIR